MLMLCAMLAALPLDAPLNLVPLTAAASASELPDSLVQARRLSEELRFEEALVEYQRYLGTPDRPNRERGQALFELGFIHLLLADEVNAERRALEALELHPTLSVSPEASAKQSAFLERARKLHASRPRIELLPKRAGDAPSRVTVQLTDPLRQVRTVSLRHALAPEGPFHATAMKCAATECAGTLPPPAGQNEYTAWYFVDAVDSEGNTVARASSPTSPLQLFVREEDPWFRNPLVWVGGAALVVGAAAVVYVAAGAGR